MTLEELIEKVEAAIEIDDNRAQLNALRALRQHAGAVMEHLSSIDREAVITRLTQGLGSDALQILRGLKGRVAA